MFTHTTAEAGTNSVRLLKVDAETLDDIWEAALPMLRDKMKFAFHEINESTLYSEIIRGYAQLWVAEQDDHILGLMVTSLPVYDSGVKMCRIDLVTGKELDKLTSVWKDLETWALKQGCLYMRTDVRPGMERALKHLGFDKARSTVFKKLRKEH